MKAYDINNQELFKEVNNLKNKGYKVLDTMYGIGGIDYIRSITLVVKNGVTLDTNEETKTVYIKAK